VIVLFATGVALTGLAVSYLVIGIYRLVDQTGIERGWWQ
jgi:hypothetical protein